MVALVGAAALAFAQNANAVIFTVNSANDANDEVCDLVHCSLREAINAANADRVGDVIRFSIGSGGAQTITPTSALPNLATAMTIDGTTQPGFSGTPIIEIKGSNAGGGVTGFSVPGAGVSITGLVINSFGGHGISLTGGANSVYGNYIGTDPSGTLDLGNGLSGVSSSGAFNTIGGTVPSLRNVISGNSGNGIQLLFNAGGSVRGNYIGLNAAGTSALGNGGSGIFTQAAANAGGFDVTIGGTEAGAGNVISGNGSDVNNHHGINVFAGDVLIQGNRIGTNAAGTAAVANAGSAIVLESNFTTVGGTAAGAGNLLSGNGGMGLLIRGDFNPVQGNLIGTNAAGTGGIGNFNAGIFLAITATGNTIGGIPAGAGNHIAHNTGPAGIFVVDGSGQPILGNSIHDNGGLGIDLAPQGVNANDAGDADTGPNDLQNFPVITSAAYTTSGLNVQGTLNSVPSQTYHVEIFANAAGDATSAHGEGETFVGALVVSTDASGNGALNETFATTATGKFISATASDSGLSRTSEFSAFVAAADQVPPETTITSAPSDYVQTGTVTFAFSSNEEGTFQCRLNTAEFTACTSPKTYTGLADGPYSFEVRAVDTSQNVDATPAQHLWSIDTVTANGTLDQHQGKTVSPTTGGSTLGGANDQKLAQIFTPSVSGPLTDARVMIGCLSPGTTTTATVEIQTTTTSGAPSGTVLASANVQSIGVSPVFRKFAFSSPAYLTAGTKYALVVSSLTSVTGCYVPVSPPNPYPDPSYFRGATDASWQLSANEDLPFATFMNGSVIFTVTNANDSGAGSLRQAILDANSTPIADTIRFSVGSGPVTISPTSALPPITNPVTIDGATQPGFAGTPLIRLDSALSATDGLVVSNNSTVTGLMITGFSGNGIVVSGDNNFIRGNYIGTNGTADLGNGNLGILVQGTGNIIGGEEPGSRNVISGNNGDGIAIPGSDNKVKGNYIGTNASGSGAVPNSIDGIRINAGLNNLIGGTTPLERNVISGNQAAGVRINAPSTKLWGNFIGTDATGTSAVPNANGIILMGQFNPTNTEIGQPAPGGGNLISGNTEAGIFVGGVNTTGISIRSNSIGTDVTGSAALPNGLSGVALADGANNVQIGARGVGEGNHIAYNGGIGVRLGPGTGTGIAILANSIHDNAGLGIDIDPPGVNLNDPGDTDTGPNNRQNFPVITSAKSIPNGSVRITATFSGQANTTYQFDWYASPTKDPSNHGEGKQWIGFTELTTDGSGDLAIDTGSGLTAPVPEGSWITGTATAPNPSTSEFSLAVKNVGAFVVNSTADPGAGGCDETECTLREAILAANTNPGPDEIRFDIPGEGVKTISPTSALPIITSPVTIDGYTQPGAKPPDVLPLASQDLPASNAKLLIELDGSLAGVGTKGLEIQTSNSTVKGLVVNDFPVGIALTTAQATNNLVHGNFIGTNAAGTAADGNTQHGVEVSSGAANNTIGKEGSGAGNVISGNGDAGVFISGASGNQVMRNVIGLDVVGTENVPNARGVVLVNGATNNTIGDTIVGSRSNFIAGNSGNGVEVRSSGNTIRNNFVGFSWVFPDGTLFKNMGNGGHGVLVAASNTNVIANTIANNDGDGVAVVNASDTTGVFIGSSIRNNAGLGIDLGNDGVTANDLNDADTGPNNLQNFPVLTSASQPAPGDNIAVTGTLNSTPNTTTPNTTYTIHLYANRVPGGLQGTGGGCDPSGFGEGQSGAFATVQVTTDAAGNASFSAPVPPPTAGEDLAGAFMTATATAPGDNTSEFSQCLKVTGLVEDLSLTVQENALPTGWGELPLSQIPNAALPLFAGPLTVAPGATPPSSPVGSIPVGSIPVGSIPVGSIPVGSIPVGSIPVGSIPVGSIGLAGTPVGSIPLQFVLASSIPIDWSPIVAGTPLEGRPTQSFTLQDVLDTPVASANFANNVTLAQAGLENTVLKGVNWSSILIGNKTVAQVPPPGGTVAGAAAWTAVLDNDSGVTDTTTILGLDIAGRLSSTPVGSIPVGSIAGGIAGTPVGSIPVGSIFFDDARIGEVVIGNIGNPAAVVDCSLLTSCLTKTLADAKAAGAILASATLADLTPAIDHLTINELVIAVVGRAGLPWEAFPVSDFAAYSSPQTIAHYRAQFTVACPLSTLQARIRLPFHFILKPGTSQLSLGGGPLQPVSDPATDATTGATYTLGSGVCTGAAATQTVDLRFQATTGSRVGTLASSLFVTRDGKTSTASNEAPLLVQQRGEPDDTTPPIIEKDTIILRHTPTTGDVDKFRLAIPPRNTRVRIFLGHLSADLDLAVEVPEATVLSSPVGSIPVGSIPIEDRGTSITGDNPPLSAEGLQDIPVGSIPVGSIPVGSISINRGTADEVAEVVSDGEAGFYTIHVIPYNGATSADGYTLRVQEIPPPTLPPCPARSFPFDSDPDGAGGQAEVAVSLPDPALLPDTTKTLFLMLDNQLRDLYGSAAANSLLAALDPATPTNVSAHPQVQGVTLKLDANAAVKSKIQALNANPCSSPDEFVKAVNDALTPYRNELPNLKYLVFLGTNEAFPMGWKRDRVTLSNATDYAANLLFTTQNGTQANASYAAAFTGHVLTDDVYTSLTQRSFLGESFPLPDLVSGRLVETPAEMVAQMAQAGAANFQLDASTIQTYTASYDFLLDGGVGVNTTFVNTFGFANTLARLTNTWDAPQVQSDYFANATPRSVGAVWGHYDHYRMQPATGTTLVSTESVDDATTGLRFPGRVLFTVGCNAGQNVADTLIQNFSSNPAVAADQQKRLRDWAQAWARQKTAVYLANTSFGYGDTDFVALSEKLGNLFAARLPENTTMGEKFVAVKHDYFNQMGTYGVFDEKALVEWTLYGLPQWKLSAGTAPAPPTPPSTSTGPGALQSATINLTSTDLAKQQVNTDRGTFFRAADGSTHSQPYRQPQSVHDFDETVPGLQLRGALFKALATTNVTVNPHLHIPTIDAKTHEPEPSGSTFTDTFFPANFVSVTRTGGRDILTVVDTQQRPTSPPSANVVTRLVTGLDVQLLYAPAGSADGAPPLFLESGLTRTGKQATLFARVSGNPILVEALVTQNGTSWQHVALTTTPGTNIWTATITLAVDAEASAFFDAANAFGRVAYTTDKGDLHQSVPAPAVAEELSVVIDTPEPGAVYKKDQVVNAKYGCTGRFITQCAGPVANGAPINTGTIGEKTFTVNAQNVNGNKRSKTVTYGEYDFGGFFRPIDNPPTLNKVKAGSAVPVKFSLSGNQGLDILSSDYPKSQQIACDTAAPVNDVTETTTAGSSSLSYDATTDRYTYVWKTSSAWAGACRQLIVRLNDGTEHPANFKF